jgi:2-polyprenyl-6-methoxyphenol hydroxylase-like FAD-dependent oxidoreductase
MRITGAGFAGLASAIALQQRGWSWRAHEKEAMLRAFGAGIFVA